MGGPDSTHLVEVRAAGAPPREVAVNRRIDVGRDCDGILLDDPLVSRRHLSLHPGTDGLVVSDLGSRNGTRVNGVRITGPVTVRSGDVIEVGNAKIVVVSNSVGDPSTDERATLTAPAVSGRPALEELHAIPVDGAVVRFRPGTAGERAAPGMAAALRRAARRLSGLGPDLRTIAPQVCLVDPFPDPSDPRRMVTTGSVVDAARREIWMVVTPEAPPEPLERPLALLLGASLPAARELDVLLEGYGLAVSDAPVPDEQLRTMDLPTLDEAEGELRTAMVHSFVAFLLERSGRADFLRMITTAPADGLEAALHEVYGQGSSALEETWAEMLEAPSPRVSTGQFVRLTIRYLRPYVPREVELFLWMLLGLAFTVVFPFVTKALFDTAIPERDFGEVVRLVGFLGGAFVVSLLAGLRQTYLGAYVSNAVTRDIRVSMFGKMQRLSAGWFNRQQEGDVLSRLFSDVEMVEQGVSQTVREGVFQTLSLVVSAAVLLTLDLLLGAIVLVGAPLVAVVYRVMASGARKRSLAVQEELGTTYTVASENYGAHAVVKAFGLEDRERERFERASQRLFGRELRLSLFGGVFSLSVNMIVTALQLVILGLGAWLILEDRLTLGELVAFTTMMGQVLSPVATLTGIGQMTQAASGALVRINEVLEASPDVEDDDATEELPPLEREIRLEGVGFSYTAERKTLEDVSCVIPAGSRVAFVGPTGAGKSSVLQLLMRFYDVDEGAVLFDGRDIRQVKLASLRRQLGVVFQDTFLFDTTIRENIAIGLPGVSDDDIRRVSQAAELHEFVETLPRGYNTLVGERGGRLSGGQRQRLAIARALLRDPKVLLLDEATSALDPRTERMISDTLSRIAQGRTTVAVTHRLTSITGYDRIFVMSGGRLVEQGTHEELLARGGTYAELWAEQTAGIAPVEPPFDAPAALAAVSIFSGLSQSDLVAAAARLRALDVQPGERLPEGGGALMFVRRGRPQVFTPGLDGRLALTAELQPGDAFGLSALFGEETGAVLVAEERVGMLVLDADALRDLSARHPSIGDMLVGNGRRGPAPLGGARLSRASLHLRPLHRVAAPAVDAPTAEDVRRMSGTFRSVQP